MTAVEHSPVNRADEGDQSQASPRTDARLDREKANGILNAAWRNEITHATALDALEGCVVPDPPQALDRAALIEVLRGAIPPRMTEGYYARVADRILALVQPVEGVLLTPEEAWVAGEALQEWNYRGHITSRSIDVHSLAARLEASA